MFSATKDGPKEKAVSPVNPNIQQEKHPMGIRKYLLLFVLFSMLIPLTGLSNSTQAQSYSQIKLDPNRVPWTQLSYKIKNFYS